MSKKYSGFHSTICVNPSYAGYTAGVGRVAGPDPREMAKSDLVVIWGTNPVNTQVNVMTHATRARKERGAKIAAVDIYMNGTMSQADLPVLVKPGTDGALACAVMHCLFRDGKADWDYLDKYTDAPRELEAHLRTRDPQWASAITGTPVETIEAFAKLIGETKRAYFRLGYGFARSRNGAANMHAASCIAAVTGAWQYEGGGAFHINADIFKLDMTLIEGRDVWDRSVRMLDQSQIGAILTGDKEALAGGPPVDALIIQNTNPVSVAPDQNKVKQGFAREDLFVCVHEQFMTETAQVADVVLPATTFLEHDDIYRGGGHQYIILGPKLVEPPGECRNNHEVICALAKRLGAEHKGFTMSPRELIDDLLRGSNRGTLDRARSRPLARLPAARSGNRIISTASPGRRASSASSRTGRTCRSAVRIRKGRLRTCRRCLTIGPRSSGKTVRIRSGWRRRRRAAFLNSTFNETPTSLANEKRPTVMIHPDDAAALDIGDGDRVVLGNARGEVRLHAKVFDGVRRGVLDRGIDLAQFGLRRRLRHQHAHRRRSDRALWRRCLPRQQGVGAAAQRLSRRLTVRAPCRSCGRWNRARRRELRWPPPQCRSTGCIRSRRRARQSRAPNAPRTCRSAFRWRWPPRRSG